MQALLARRNRVSTAMVGDTRAGGSMTDASKRRFCVEEDDEHEEWSLATEAKDVQKSSVPVRPRAEFLLPKGVESVAQWGKVVTTTEAWKKEKITFSKAVPMAEHNEKMRKYVNFILGKFGEKACEEPPTQGVDLAMYLQAINYQPKKGYERTFAP